MLAPLHNPHNLRGYRAARSLLARRAAHRRVRHRLPPVDAAARLRLRRSLQALHASTASAATGSTARRTATSPSALHAARQAARRAQASVTCHLGNGCSMAAVDRGRTRSTPHGLHAARGPPHGHALRRHRPGRPALGDGDGGAHPRPAQRDAQQALRPARHLRRLLGHARGAGRARRGQPARDARLRHLLLPHPQVHRRLRGGAWAARRRRLHRRHRRELPRGPRGRDPGARLPGPGARPQRNQDLRGSEGEISAPTRACASWSYRPTRS